ncbi:hypothetical protein OBJ94_08745 [Empedobacter falsenii]
MTKIVSYILVILVLIFAKVFNYLDSLPEKKQDEGFLNSASDLYSVWSTDAK